MDVLSIILKKIGSSKFSLIKSEYLADMAKGEFFKSNLDKNIILKDYYDRKHSIPHLRTIIFQNQMSKPGIWPWWTYAVWTSKMKINVNSDKYNAVRAYEIDNNKTQYFTNSCDLVNNIFENYESLDEKDLCNLTKSTILNQKKSSEILKLQGRSKVDLVQIKDIKTYIKHKVNGKTDFIVGGKKILSIYGKELLEIALKASFNDYENLKKWRFDQIDSILEKFEDEDLAPFISNITLNILEDILEKRGIIEFDRTLASINSNDPISISITEMYFIEHSKTGKIKEFIDEVNLMDSE